MQKSSSSVVSAPHSATVSHHAIDSYDELIDRIITMIGKLEEKSSFRRKMSENFPTEGIILFKQPNNDEDDLSASESEYEKFDVLVLTQTGKSSGKFEYEVLFQTHITLQTDPSNTPKRIEESAFDDFSDSNQKKAESKLHKIHNKKALRNFIEENLT